MIGSSLFVMDAINSCDSNQNFGDHFRWLKNVPCSICCCFYFRFSMSLSVNVFCPICWRRHPKPTAIIMSSAKWRHDLNRWVECDWRKIFHVLKLDNWNSLGDLPYFVGVLSSLVPGRGIASFYSSFLVCLNVYLLFFFLTPFAKPWRLHCLYAGVAVIFALWTCRLKTIP